MNNFHIYEEVGRGKYSVVYKVSFIHLTLTNIMIIAFRITFSF